jgi:hypothetical protein
VDSQAKPGENWWIGGNLTCFLEKAVGREEEEPNGKKRMS